MVPFVHPAFVRPDKLAEGTERIATAATAESRHQIDHSPSLAVELRARSRRSSFEGIVFA